MNVWDDSYLVFLHDVLEQLMYFKIGEFSRSFETFFGDVDL